VSADVWYLDASAIVKLVLREPESDSLRAWLADGERRVVTSDLSLTEVARAAARVSVEASGAAQRVLGTLTTIRCDRSVFDEAGSIRPSALRSLDAIHLAAAAALGADLAGIVTYDWRMADAARKQRTAVASPGTP